MAGSLLGYDRLAETLEEIRAQVVALSTVPQLSRSSIEAGAILEFDADGNQVSQIGEQFDGGHAAISLSGPKPPTPSAPGLVDTGGGAVNVLHDGTFLGADGAPDITISVPTDYSSTEIHASQDPGFTAETWDTLTDSYTTSRGGLKTIGLAAGTWYVKLVTRTLSGNRSDPSPAATVVVAAAITDQDLAAMEQRFDQDMATLSGNLTALDQDLTIAEGRITTAEQNITSAFGRLDVVEPIASGAAGDAAAAQETADQAAADALAAAGIAAEKGKVWFQPASPPAGTTYKWAGAEHGSASIQNVDGVEVRRNHAFNPEAASITGWSNIGGATHTRSVENTLAHSGTTSVKMSLTGSGGLGAKCSIVGGLLEGEVVSWSLWVYTSKTIVMQPYWERNAPTYTGGNGGPGITVPANTWTQIIGTMTVTAAQAAETGTFGFGAFAPSGWLAGDTFWVDEILIEKAATLGTYFAGSTPDDRAFDLWVDTDDGNKPYRWDAATDAWVLNTDQRIIDAAAAAAAAQTRADDAHTLAGTAKSTADSALTAAGTKTTVTYSTSAPAGNGAKTGDTHRQQTSATDRNIIAEWYWDGDSWEPQQVTNEMVSNFDVGKLTAGAADIVTVVAQKIAAASGQYIDLDVKQLNVTDSALIKTGVAESFFTKYFTTNRLSANHIYVGPGENLLADPKFLDDVMLTKRREASTGGTAGWAVIAGVGNDPRAVRKTTTSGGEWWRFLPIAPATANVNEYLSVEPGRKYKWTADVSTDISATITWRVALAKANGTITWVSYTPTGATAAGRRALTFEWACPADVVAIAPELYTATIGTVWTVYGAAVIAPKTDGSLIVDGLINGKTVIGARIATADTGARIELNGTPGNNKLFGVDTAGVTYMNFTDTGAWLKAVLEIDAPLYNQVVKLGPQALTTGQNAAGLGFYKTIEPAGDVPPLVTSTDGDSIRIEGRKPNGGANPAFIEVMMNDQIQIFGSTSIQGNLTGIQNLEAYDLNVFTQIDSQSLVTGTSNLGYNGNGYYVRFASGFPGLYLRNDGTTGVEKSGDAALWAPAGGNTLYVRAPIAGTRGAFRIDTGTLLEYYDPPTSTFTANLGIASNPKDRIYKLTSSGAKKVNQEPISDERAWRILAVQPRKWYDLTQIEEQLGPDAVDRTNPIAPTIDPAKLQGLGLRMHPGLIAQEVHAAGLGEYVTYTKDGEVEAVDYDRMWTLILPILRYLLERVGYPSDPKVPIKPTPLTPPTKAREGLT